MKKTEILPTVDYVDTPENNDDIFPRDAEQDAASADGIADHLGEADEEGDDTDDTDDTGDDWTADDDDDLTACCPCDDSDEEGEDEEESEDDACPEGFNMIDALDYVQMRARGSKLSAKFIKGCARQLDYLSGRLGLTHNQVVLVSLLCEEGRAMSWRSIGRALGVSRLRAMTLTDDFNDLRRRRWVMRYAANENGSLYEGYKLVYGVVTALRNNRPFEPERIDSLTEQALVDRIGNSISAAASDSCVATEELHGRLLELVEANRHLPLCRLLSELGDDNSRLFMLFVVNDYARYCGTDNEGLHIDEVERWFKSGWEVDRMCDELSDGTHVLMMRGILENVCEDGIADTERFRLTRKSREDLLGSFKPRAHRRRGRKNDRDLRPYAEIKEKTLYYNEEEERQIDRLRRLLSGDGLAEVQSRLDECGMRRGIACLFYGTPGTGKTESVMQLARATGRDIMVVDIAAMRDKFVGESEKNIKGVFNRYRSLCRGCDRMPILLFNEADAIFGNRFESVSSSVEKMDNAMQNIILQEMEDLDGILIATTNLTGNLDRAFDRRFLFKVEFSRPSAKARESIWRAMMPWLDGQTAALLADGFDFSGGQIENIARKCGIEYALSGVRMTYEAIRTLCAEEHLNRGTRGRIGF